MDTAKVQLFYVHDPMCSWCWGYQPTLKRVKGALNVREIPFKKVLGGLAPDSDAPMPEQMRLNIESYWSKITKLLGTEFNHEFWTQNIPRGSTYSACRAVLVARKHKLETEMNLAIQHAYYLNALNPSDPEILVKTAESIGINAKEFRSDLNSHKTDKQLHDEIGFARSIGGNSFPSWILVSAEQATSPPLDYKNEATLLEEIDRAFSSD